MPPLEKFRIATLKDDGPAVRMILKKRRKSNKCVHAVRRLGAVVQCGDPVYSIWRLPTIRLGNDGTAHVQRASFIYCCEVHDLEVERASRL
jgi:hypothetical protein